MEGKAGPEAAGVPASRQRHWDRDVKPQVGGRPLNPALAGSA